MKINRRFGGICRLHLQSLQTTFTLVSCLAYSSIMKIDAIFSYETSANFQRTTLLYFPEDITLRNQRCESIKSYRLVVNCLVNYLTTLYQLQK
jgi:hypothetical protein